MHSTLKIEMKKGEKEEIAIIEIAIIVCVFITR